MSRKAEVGPRSCRVSFGGGGVCVCFDGLSSNGPSECLIFDEN